MASQDQGDGTLAEKMRLLKVEALEKGDLTDASFLVGPEGEAEVSPFVVAVLSFKFNTCKIIVDGDLLVASEYFRGLFRSPLAGPHPIRMKHVQPHIFKLLLRHISTNLVEKPLSIEDAVDLAHAADEFLLDPFKSHYLEEIKQMAKHSNVWIILNRSTISQVKSLCDEVLATETTDCLAHQSFLEASQESLLYLLQLEEMNIVSEIELIDSCLKLANTKPEEERGALMKAALPHLRLLTLIVYEIPPELLKYLTDSEKALLLTMNITNFNKQNFEGAIAGNLCLHKEPRKNVAPRPVQKISTVRTSV